MKFLQEIETAEGKMVFLVVETEEDGDVCFIAKTDKQSDEALIAAIKEIMTKKEWLVNFCEVQTRLGYDDVESDYCRLQRLNLKFLEDRPLNGHFRQEEKCPPDIAFLFRNYL